MFLGHLVILEFLGNLVILEFLGNLVILAFLVVLSNLGHLVVFMVSRQSCLTAHPRLLLYSLYYLLIKRFLKGTELVFALNTASPPCLQEPKAIAQQLSKGCCHAKQGDM